MTVPITTDMLQTAPPRTPAFPSAEERLRRRLLEVLQEPLAPPQMTYAEFLAWADEDTCAEWVDGRIIMTSPASIQQQTVADFLLKVMGAYAETLVLGMVISAPFQMKLTNGREPDLIFVAAEHVSRLRDTYLDGPADLVVEVVSPDSLGRDRGEKFTEYEAGGVPEYWLIDPQRRWAEFYQLDEDHYVQAFAGRQGEYHAAALPGFWLRVEWLWQERLPAVEDVLLQIGGESYARQWIERLRQQGFLPGA
jgi:Uma2 family endonuclease